MLAEAIESLKQLVAKAESPQLVIDQGTDQVIFVNGEIKTFSKAIKPRNHGVDAITDLIALANRFQELDTNVVVWYDEDGVTAILDDGEYREEEASAVMEKSQLYTAVASLDPRQWHTPKDFVRLLRITLNGALDPKTLLDPVRRVKFNVGATTTVENSRIKESMGKEITSSVSAASELPEFVTLVLPIYQNPGADTLVNIRAAVEIDHDRQAFQLVVLPDELEKAKAHVLRAIGAKLREELHETIHVYQGRPVQV